MLGLTRSAAAKARADKSLEEFIAKHTEWWRAGLRTGRFAGVRRVSREGAKGANTELFRTVAEMVGDLPYLQS